MSIIAVYRDVPKPPVDYTEFDFSSLPLDPRITFTRASTGTYFDASGTMQIAAINQPRIDHDPVTGEVRGLLVGEQRTNSLTWSENFGNVSWEKNRAAVSANAGIAPNGALTAGKLTENSSSDWHNMRQVYSHAANTYTFSVFAKPAGRAWVYLNTFWGVCHYDLSTGTFAGLAGAGATASISPAGNGWYRCAITYPAAAQSRNIYISPSASGSDSGTYQGDGTSGIYIWGAQLEAGAFPTSYIPTEGTAMTRGADVSDAADITDIRLNPAEGTFLVEHDAPTARPLLSSGANLIAASQGPGVLAVAYDSSGSVTFQDGASTGTGAALTFGAGLRIGASASEQANARIKRVRYYSRKLSPAEIAVVWE